MPSSNYTMNAFSPTAGWWDGPPSQAPLGSIVSGANFWVRQGHLTPRYGLAYLGSNYTPLGAGTNVMGVLEYQSSIGSATGAQTRGPATTSYPIAISQGTMAYFNGSGWSTIASLGTNGSSYRIWGASIYYPPQDSNIFVFGWHSAGASVWSGLVANDTTVRSYLNTMPFGAEDAVAHDHRLLMWNVRVAGSGTTVAPTRLVWSAYNDPLDLTSPGAGSYDLTDARGYGTRCFVWGNEVVLATTEELWRAIPTGRGAYEFQPIDRSRGIPYPASALATPDGIFWLGSDRMIYRYAGQGVEPVGQGIQRTLRQQLNPANFAYTQGALSTFPQFAWDGSSRQLTLFYVDWGSYQGSSVNGLTRAFSYSVDDKVWMPQDYSLSSKALPLAFRRTVSTTGANLTPSLNLLLSTGTMVTAPDVTIAPDGIGASVLDFASGNTVGSLDFPIFHGEPRLNKYVDTLRFRYINPQSQVTLVSTVIAAPPIITARPTGNGPSSAASMLLGAIESFGPGVFPTTEEQRRLTFPGVTGPNHILRLELLPQNLIFGTFSQQFAITEVAVEGQYGGPAI